MKRVAWLVACAIVLALPAPATAAVFRYAIVAGSNLGLDAEGKQPFLPLQHAERETQELRDKLVRLANFSDSPSRTVLLVGATRADVFAAVQRIVAQKAEDERMFGTTESLFAFFFTGHGQNGRLLLRDGPLAASELATVFRNIHATFQIGVFDACYSGSLDETALGSKGVQLTPGVNLFHEMPEEVLMAEGSVWLVSSRANDPSYEDRTLGGVFTHFFMEALEKAPADGVGITLDSIWNYARRKTVDYTSSRQRRQTPEQVVARLRTRGPMYFSFPMARTARLVLDEGLAGNVVLEYGDGQLVDTMYKQVGRRQELRVFPGPARIKLVEANRDQAQVTQFSLSVAAEAEMTYRTAIGSCMAWADPATERFTAYAPRT